MNGFLIGIKAYIPAINLLFSPRFRWFLLFPVFILVLLFWTGDVLLSYTGDSIYHLFADQMRGWLSGIPGLEWMNPVTNVMIKVILKILCFFLFIAFGGYIILIVMSPVYSWLSERTEARLTGKEYPFSWRELFREIFRGILIALRNMLLQLLLTFLFFLCSFIPLLGLIAPFAVFFTSAYFYGFSFMDYAIERKCFNVKQSVRYINRNVGAVTGVGTIFVLSLLIPWFSLIACCFVSLLSVVAGTIVVHEEEKGKLSGHLKKR